MACWSCVKFSGSDEVMLYYHLSNHSGFRIKVIFYDFWTHRVYYPNTLDTVVYFNPGEERDLLLVYNLRMYQSTEPENKDTLQGIYVLKIFKDDSIPAQKDYRLTKYWTFFRPDKYKMEYSLEITDDSFNP